MEADADGGGIGAVMADAQQGFLFDGSALVGGGPREADEGDGRAAAVVVVMVACADDADLVKGEAEVWMGLDGGLLGGESGQ